MIIKDEYIIDVPDMRHGVHQSFVSLRLIVWKLKVIVVDNVALTMISNFNFSLTDILLTYAVFTWANNEPIISP